MNLQIFILYVKVIEGGSQKTEIIYAMKDSMAVMRTCWNHQVLHNCLPRFMLIVI